MAGGRSKLTEAEKEQRRLEKEELFANRTKYTRKGKKDELQSSDTTTNMETNNNPDNKNTGNENNPVNNPVVNAGEENNNSSTTTPAVVKEEVKTNPVNTTFQPNKSWKMLQGDRIKRDYSTPVINQELLDKDIPELNIGPQNVSTQSAVETLNKPITESTAANTGKSDNTPGKPEPIKPIVENWNELSPDEQKIAAAQTTDMVLGMYDKLHMFGRMAIKKDHDDLVEAHNDDKIDMYETVTENEEDPDKDITIEDFWNDFNNQVEDRFIVSQGFKDAVRPPMERLCMKYGLGASDGIFLAFKFSEDAATKIAMLVGFKKTVAKMDEIFEKKHKKFKAAVDAEIKRREAEAKKVTDASNGNKEQQEQKEKQALIARAKAVNLPETATLAEIEEAEKKK